ncbi:MAG: hypothetical protein QG637_377 [Chloroflexota bacterium]|nr:hypothetical protein [Chloroflexota bacterium]
MMCDLRLWQPLGKLRRSYRQRVRKFGVLDLRAWLLYGLGFVAVGVLVLAVGTGVYYSWRLLADGVPAAHAVAPGMSPTPVMQVTAHSIAAPTPLTRPTRTPTVAPTPTAAPTPLPVEVLLADVPVGRQQRSLSCELQSASDLAWYHGKPYTWLEIFLRVVHDQGGNPHKGFVGASLDDPPGGIYPAGYGVYAEPIAAVLRQIGLKAEAHYGEPAEWLRGQIAQGRPVMVWGTAGMVRRAVETWTAADGTLIRGVRGEHTYLVVGYTPTGVWALNPWNAQRQFFEWAAFLAAWDLFDRMSVTVAP